ncbi:hypothetical protein [Gracilimonas halophila]|uniref:Uncharacterized protein n=1 Tax=Gracilimonas halophila TaxID=1834464 RepID=A0ABW5JMJ5_9BACT
MGKMFSEQQLQKALFRNYTAKFGVWIKLEVTIRNVGTFQQKTSDTVILF